MMKKYLMTAVAAVAMGAALTSCSHNDDLYNGGEEQKEQTNLEKKQLEKAEYNAVFEKVFGKVGANVDWGFSSKAGTRANTGENYPATSDGINANANEWADPNKEFGGWVVPDPLTAAQKEIVVAYFQTVKDLTYTDPEWRNFFVQQVYGGGNSTVRNTTEGIVAANGSVYTSENMNLLTVGANHQHINNFNGGDCSVNNDVLDNGSNVNENKHHSDQIMLMVNIDDTSCFGYHETGSSTHHDNKAAIVDWQTIRTWANANGFNGELLNDGWDRSFLGFDLAIQEGTQAMDGTATYDQAPESPEYAWDGEKVIRITTGEWKNVTIEHEYWTENKSVPVYAEGYESIFGLGFLTTNENFYKAGAKETISQTISINRAQLSSLTEIQNCVVLKEVMDGDQWYQSVINLPRIKQLVDEGYLPVKDKSLTEWVKPGKSDGYFSDWIVTLNKAKRQDEQPDVTVYRVIAEDLEVGQEATDFDFNDVIFDVTPNGTTSATIRLIAAGGIYKLTVAGREVHETFNSKYAGLENGSYPMINTSATSGGVTEAEVEFTIDGDYSTREKVKDIKVYVYKPKYNNEPQELTAEKGEAACKIVVDKTYTPLKERVSIKTAYPNFVKYVNGTFTTRTDNKWWIND